MFVAVNFWNSRPPISQSRTGAVNRLGKFLRLRTGPDHVFRFADKGDGYMDEVHALRDQYKADVALLIEHDPNGCGLAAEVYARPEKTFAALHHECAAMMYSLPTRSAT